MKETFNDPPNPKDQALWDLYAGQGQGPGYDLSNPETLNALAAWAEGRTEDPGRRTMERHLAGSSQALDDLVFVRRVLQGPLPEASAGHIRRARGLLPVRQGARRPDTSIGTGPLVTLTGGRLALLTAALLLVVVASFQTGAGISWQQATLDRLTLEELPLLNPTGGVEP